ncbi:MAG: type II toxin-antitoxin system HicB family antitoxin [Candidatus Bipolaricaulota bacterium]|nr:type II toxin-antitoxin system HicB family antitoxin [Candidatus Bipolaricaulota bacterium]
MAQQIVFRAEFFREGDLYVGLAPELNVSSFGETLDKAKESLKEAVDGFLEECETMGTLENVIEEAGFEKRGNQWLPRQPVAAELMTAQ